MLYDFKVKKPADIIVDTFDFTDFVTEVSPEAVDYVGHGDIGPTFTELSNASGLITLQIAGGSLGRTYLYGYEAHTASGESLAITRRLRIRDAESIAGVPTIASSGASAPTGELLLGSDSILLGTDYLVLS